MPSKLTLPATSGPKAQKSTDKRRIGTRISASWLPEGYGNEKNISLFVFIPLGQYILPLLFLGCIAAGQSSPTQPPAPVTPPLSHFDPSQVDRSLDPCVDFYQFTCKKWMANNPIPPDQVSWWLGTKLMIWNQSVARDILEKSSGDDPARNPAQQKIGDYYASCMNEQEINTKGFTAIKPELDRIDAMHSKAQLAEEIAHIHQITFALIPKRIRARPPLCLGSAQARILMTHPK